MLCNCTSTLCIREFDIFCHEPGISTTNCAKSISSELHLKKKNAKTLFRRYKNITPTAQPRSRSRLRSCRNVLIKSKQSFRILHFFRCNSEEIDFAQFVVKMPGSWQKMSNSRIHKVLVQLHNIKYYKEELFGLVFYKMTAPIW